MCIVVAKYFDNIGWVGVKNRDRNYVPEISFKRTTHDDLEIMLFWDDITRYCEGMNSAGIAILSASLMVKDDEKEIETRSKKRSPDGVRIQRALKYATLKDAIRSLIKDKLTGNTVIFNQHNCYLLEGAWRPDGYKQRDYVYKVHEIDPDQTIARTNHGVWIKWAGYQRDAENKNQTMSRISSESRRDIAQYVVDHSNKPEEIIDGLAGVYIDNPQLNCLRTTHQRKKMRTTSQTMIIPSEETLFVRPVQSNMTFNFWSINDPKHHLWVEILSNRVLYRDKKRANDPAPPRMQHKAE